MYSRLTQLEIDPVRGDVASALGHFRDEVLPELHDQPGFAGVLVLTTPDGKGLLLSFWDTAEAADASAATGFYAEVLQRYMTLFRSPPGRERYEVVLADLPALLGG